MLHLLLMSNWQFLEGIMIEEEWNMCIQKDQKEEDDIQTEELQWLKNQSGAGRKSS